MKKLSALMLSAALCFTSVPVFANEVVADEEESTAAYSVYSDYEGWVYNSNAGNNTVLSVPCKGTITFSLINSDTDPIKVLDEDGNTVANVYVGKENEVISGLYAVSIKVDAGKYFLSIPDGKYLAGTNVSFTAEGNYTGWQFNGYNKYQAVMNGDSNMEQPKYEIWYYYKNDKLTSGWQYINGSWYYFYLFNIHMPSQGMTTGSSLNLGNMMAVSSWIYESETDPTQRYYVTENGKMAKNTWVHFTGGTVVTADDLTLRYSDGSDIGWSYVKGDGKPETSSWHYSKGKWYWLDENGMMAADEWIEQDGKWYYLRPSGAMAVNETICGHKFDSKGVWQGKVS